MWIYCFRCQGDICGRKVGRKEGGRGKEKEEKRRNEIKRMKELKRRIKEKMDKGREGKKENIDLCGFPLVFLSYLLVYDSRKNVIKVDTSINDPLTHLTQLQAPQL